MKSSEYFLWIIRSMVDAQKTSHNAQQPLRCGQAAPTGYEKP